MNGKFKTEVLKPKNGQQLTAAVLRAAEVLRGGGLVALPTETVYGLAANALDSQAVSRIFEVKGRPSHNPIIVHVCDLPMARRCVSGWTERAERAAQAFWPGPLTLVLPRADIIPKSVTAGGETVGVRWPSHPVIQEVIRACGFPLAAPSANLSNQVSPTTAEHVFKQLAGRIPLIIDAGPCDVGIESTVLDLCSPAPRILRPGMLDEAALERVIGPLAVRPESAPGPLRSPGMLARHYSPRARLVLCEWKSEEELAGLARACGAESSRVAIISTRIAPGQGWARTCLIGNTPKAYAQDLYSALHACDDSGASVILLEQPPTGRPWRGVWDRLRRAAAST